MKKTQPKIRKLIDGLLSGKKYTPSKIRALGLANPSAAIWQIRNVHDVDVVYDGVGYVA